MAPAMTRRRNDMAHTFIFAVWWMSSFIKCADTGYKDGDRTGSSDVTSRGGHSPRPLSDEERLMERLFTNYNPAARPVLNSSKTVSVAIQFSLMHIKELDVRSQIFTTTGLLILEWQDERLTWDPAENNNMTEIIIEASGLWRPEFAVINGAEKIYENYNQFRAVISSEGVVHWEPGGVFKTMCEIDITYYPFDEQKCALTFGAWSYHTAKMNLTNMDTSINMDSYSQNGEWDIASTPVVRNEFSYECCPNERFSNVAFYVSLRRRHTFYILNVILPSIMTSVLLLSIFFCTPGQKVQIGVVVLLSFRIFLLNVSGNIPKTSDHIPLLGIYLTCTMAITTLSMVLTVFVLNLHHITDRPVPVWAKTLVFVYLARMLGMCGDPKDEDDPRNDDSQINRKPGNVPKCTYTGLSGNDEDPRAVIELENQSGKHSSSMATSTTPSVAVDSGSPWIRRNSFKVPPPNHLPAMQLCHLGPACSSTSLNNIDRAHQDKRPDNNYYGSSRASTFRDRTPDFAKDWRRMAEIFDRLFFWLFLLAILVTTLILFHPLTKSYIQQGDSPET